MKKLLFTIALLLMAGSAWGATYYVSPSGNGTAPTTGSWATAYPDVDTAVLNATSDGDVIVLEKVTNHVWDTTRQLSANITIRNEDNDEDYSSCVVDFADDTMIRSTSGDVTENLTIKGITLGNVEYTANTDALFKADDGDTGYTGDLTFIGCRFTGITADNAGAAYGNVFRIFADETSGGTLTMTNCVIDHNDASNDSNFICYVQGMNVVIDNLYYHDNGAIGKGGCFKVSTEVAGGQALTLTVTSSVFTDNVHLNTAQDGGDGILSWANGIDEATATMTGTITGCTFSGNVCNAGGAIYIAQDATGIIDRCFFYNNEAKGGGGAIRRGGERDNEVSGYGLIKNSIFVGNTAGSTGGAIDITGNANRHKWAKIYNCTFSGNTSTGNGETIHAVDSNAALSDDNDIINCIIAGAMTGSDHIYGDGNDGFGNIEYCNITDGTDGITDSGATTSNIQNGTTTDPKFRNTAKASTYGLKLRGGSPAINAGTSGGSIPTTDIEGKVWIGNNEMGCHRWSEVESILSEDND